jgi:hypothetical protein
MNSSFQRRGVFSSARVVSVVTVLATSASAAAPRQQQTDWSSVEQAPGRSGTMMPGDVYRIGTLRSDLKVTVEGVPVQDGFALGSYAAFKQSSFLAESSRHVSVAIRRCSAPVVSVPGESFHTVWALPPNVASDTRGICEA